MTEPSKKATPRLTVPAPTLSGSGEKTPGKQHTLTGGNHSEGQDEAEEERGQEVIECKALLEDVSELHQVTAMRGTSETIYLLYII